METRDKLIEQHRYINVEDNWWDSVYDDFRMICSIIGVDLDKNEPQFSGFASQGDGASFMGVYRAFVKHGYSTTPATLYYETAPAKIREHAPEDTELHRIADELCLLSRIYFPITISVARFGASRYVHEQTMDCLVEPMDGDPDDWAEEVHAHAQEQGTLLMRDLARWLYRTLEDEYDYLTSDEAVWDTIEANGLCEAHNEGEE
jgi:hypothetical protein